MSDPNTAGENGGTQKYPLAIVPSKFGGLTVALESFEQVYRLATIFAASGEMVPKLYRDNPAGAAMAIMWGLELDITPIQAIQGIAVIGGKASVWGDLAVALVQRHADYEGQAFGRVLDEQGRFVGYYYELRRRGVPAVRQEYTLAHAEAAGLIEYKAGKIVGRTPAWHGSYERMCFNRARAFAQRDQFADALRGLSLADETQDYIDLPSDRWTEKPAAASSPAAPEPMPQPKARPSGDDATRGEAGDPAAPSVPIEFRDMETPQDLELDPTTADAERDALRGLVSPAPAAAQGDAPQASASGAGESRKPLSKGQRAALDAALARLKTAGLTEQSVVDEMGDSIHDGNFKRAVAWLAAQSPAVSG